MSDPEISESRISAVTAGLKSPVGVLLVNFGTPDEATKEDVKRFMASYISDGRVMGTLHYAMLTLKSSLSMGELYDEAFYRYQAISDDDDKFVYKKTCANLRREIVEELHTLEADNVVVMDAFRYGSPSINSGMAHLVKQGCKHILVLPLYPQSSFSFTGSVSDEYKREKHKFPGVEEFRFVDNFHDDLGYIRAEVSNIIDHVDLGAASTKLLFVFRSIPLKDVAHGDSYELQTSSTALAIADALGLERKQWTIAYLPYDQIGNQKLLEPDVWETMERFHMSKTRDIAVVCPGTTIDSVDTLYEIDVKLRAAFEHCPDDAGNWRFQFVPSLGDSHEFAAAIADLIYGNIYGWESHYMS